MHLRDALLARHPLTGPSARQDRQIIRCPFPAPCWQNLILIQPMSTRLVIVNAGSPTGLKFSVEFGDRR
ncbi:MAG TPA: hypothetical protein VK131_12905, partial [Candidatus Acidoferrales bacterium]|nr:hypothetical protein [Candidatus Acidoferrales bacterium]